MNSGICPASDRGGKGVGCLGAAVGRGSDYSEWGVYGPGGEQGLYDYTEYYDEAWDYDGSGNSGSNSTYANAGYRRWRISVRQSSFLTRHCTSVSRSRIVTVPSARV